jgi:hypothetical protein
VHSTNTARNNNIILQQRKSYLALYGRAIPTNIGFIARNTLLKTADKFVCNFESFHLRHDL